MSTVKVKAGYAYPVDVPDTTVEVVEGVVMWEGEQIGYVWKGERAYSPPIHKGSRIVKYNKQVPEWHGDTRRKYGAAIRRDTRQEVLRELIAIVMTAKASR